MHAAEWDVQEASGGVVAPLELAVPAADTKGPKAAFAEHVNTKEKMQEFADKLILCQEHDVQITINQAVFASWTRALRHFL